MHLRASFTALAASALFVAGPARADLIDFDALAVGTVLSDQFPGVSFAPNAFSGAGISSSGEAWATNTDMTIVSAVGTDVGGLGGPALVSGNLLRSLGGWSLENGDASFSVSFAAPLSSFSATFASVGVPGDVTMWAYNGNSLLGSVSGTSTGQFVLTLSAASITRVAIRPGSYNDWVGVDNISTTAAAVPEAGTWALMTLGLGLLALKRRRAG